MPEFVTKADLAEFVTKADLADFVTKADLADFVTKADLADFVTKADLADFVTKANLKEEVKEAVDAAVGPAVQAAVGPAVRAAVNEHLRTRGFLYEFVPGFDGETCCICMGNEENGLVVRTTCCRQTYHADACLFKTFNRSYSCPTCRARIIPYKQISWLTSTHSETFGTSRTPRRSWFSRFWASSEHF